MVLIALLLLMPLPAGAERRAEASAEAVSAEAGDGTRLFGGPLELDSLGRSGFELDLDETDAPPARTIPPQRLPRGPWSNARPPCQARRPPRRRLSRRSRGPRPSTRQPPRRLPILAEAARLCTELAQVADTDQLRQLLGRASSLLRAPGIVVWLGGVNGQSLRPAFSHGYSQQTLARMQAIGRDDENAVSAAYRSGKLQAVAAGEQGSAALVAPLLAPAGCIGAMAVEVGRGADQDPGQRALAELIAAQLATLMPADSE